jgi:two-component system, chemotaxis family, protein-glutamate methylesterase/glutaminase
VSSPDFIVIGGSAGALEVLIQVLPALPPGFDRALAIVLHLLPDKPSHLAEVLQRYCALDVVEVCDKEQALPAHVYVAPPDYHLLLERDGSFSLSVDDPVHFSRPSIDVLFESAAAALGPRGVGVLLSGANADGAEGLDAIRRAGGLTVVQAPTAAQASAMPEAALARFQPTRVLPPAELGPYLCTLRSAP